MKTLRTIPRLLFVAFFASFVYVSAPIIERDGWLIWFATSGFTFIFFGVAYVWGYISAARESHGK